MKRVTFFLVLTCFSAACSDGAGTDAGTEDLSNVDPDSDPGEADAADIPDGIDGPGDVVDGEGGDPFEVPDGTDTIDDDTPDGGECDPGATERCTTGEGAPGTRTCGPAGEWGACTSLPGLVYASGKEFYRDGVRFAVKGVNYFPAYFPPIAFYHSWFEDGFYNAGVVEDELALLQNLGFNLVSIQFIPPDPADAACASLNDFIARAAARGILTALFLDGSMEAARYVSLIGTCGLAGNADVFAYDIWWEPHLGPAADRTAYDPAWRSWLEERFGSLAAAQSALGGDLSMPGDDELCGEGFSLRTALFRRAVDDIVGRRIGDIAEAVRGADPYHMVGMRTGYGGNGSRWACPSFPLDLRTGAAHLDFTSPEGYALPAGDAAGILARGGFTTAYGDVGKPVFWAEFGIHTLASSGGTTEAGQAAFFGDMFEMMGEVGADGGAWWWLVGQRPRSDRDGEVSDYGIIVDHNLYPTSIDSHGVTMRDGWLGFCGGGGAWSLIVSHDDVTGEDHACPGGTSIRGSFKPDTSPSGDTAVGADGRSIRSGWLALCGPDDGVLLVVTGDDTTGESWTCPGGYVSAGAFKPDPSSSGPTGSGYDGRTIRSGWMTLCVRSGLAPALERLRNELGGTSAACSTDGAWGRFKPDTAPMLKAAAAGAAAILASFDPAERTATTWITVDRDAAAGDWKMYENGTAAWGAAWSGSPVGVRTPCTGTDSTDAQACIGGQPYDGVCPPRCLNAEIRRVEILDASGTLVVAAEGAAVEVAGGLPVEVRVAAVNTGEGAWLDEADAGGNPGAVRFGCNENLGPGCRQVLAGTVASLQAASSGTFEIPAVAATQTVVFQMVAENVAWFGDRFSVTLVPR